MKQSPKPPDSNSRAFAVVAEAAGTGELPKMETDAERAGRIGGHVRSAKLTPERRSEIARKAAQARWAKEAAS